MNFQNTMIASTHPRIHASTLSNTHFVRLFDEYHEVNREIRRIEKGVENTSGVYLENLEKIDFHRKINCLDDRTRLILI